jgi:hypothetical protein
MTYEEAMQIKGRLLTDEEAAIIMAPLVAKYGRQRGKKVKEGESLRTPNYDGCYPVYRGDIKASNTHEVD